VPNFAQWGTNCYPPALFYLLLPLPWSLNLFVLLHLLLAGAGMQRLAKRWTAHSFGAAFAAVAYVFNGVTLSCLFWPNYIVSLAWLPWVFLLAEDAAREGGRKLVLAAIVSALQVLSGTPEVTFLTWLLLGTVLLVEMFGGRLPAWSAIRRVFWVVLLAAGLVMIQLLPFFDLLAHSQRDSAFGTSRWAMPLWGWANLLIPMFHNAQTPYGTWFQYGQEFLTSYYLGAATLVLGVCGVWLARDRRAITLGIAALGCWVMALGSEGIVFDWFKRAFPMMGVARYPIKFVILTGFILPLLAAWALAKLPQTSNRNGLRLLVIGGGSAVLLMTIALWSGVRNPLPYDQWPATIRNALERTCFLAAILAAAWFVSRRQFSRWSYGFSLAALALVIADAITLCPKLVPTVAARALYPGFWEAAQKSRPPNPGEARVFITPEADRLLLYRNIPNFEDDFTGKRLAQWSNLNLLDRVPKVNGAVTLRIREQDRLEQYLNNPSNHVGDGLLDFLAARWKSSPTNPTEWVERPGALPVITAGQKPVFLLEEEMIPRLAADTFDPRTEVFLPETVRAQVTVTNTARCQVTNVVVGHRRITFDVFAEQPGLVVLAQTYFHPWQASVDGTPVPLWRANSAFQALEVVAGQHQVRLDYRDSRFALGAVLTALSSLACGILWWRSRPASTGCAPGGVMRSQFF
jgi:hypothetical protein